MGYASLYENLVERAAEASRNIDAAEVVIPESQCAFCMTTAAQLREIVTKARSSWTNVQSLLELMTRPDIHLAQECEAAKAEVSRLKLHNEKLRGELSRSLEQLRDQEIRHRIALKSAQLKMGEIQREAKHVARDARRKK